MPVKNRFAELLPEITAWRCDIHAHPEILVETTAPLRWWPRSCANLAVTRW